MTPEQIKRRAVPGKSQDKRKMENTRSSGTPIYEKYVSNLLDGRYRIEKVLGTGGMAVVFRAHDEKEDRMVAIKMLRDDIAGDPEAVARFVNESRAVSMLSHPNIVAIHDVSVETVHKYLVMEYIDGVSLRAYMDKRGALPAKEIISYTEQILSALVHAHSKGVVHRDIKPQNIMLLKDGTVKVMDFGIAKLPDSDTAAISDKTVGTVYYISPEQAQDSASDARSDLYSLGVMMYEMSTGKLPFDDESPISVVLMHMHDKPTPPHRVDPSIPRGLEQIILYSMEKNPAKRYQCAADMLREVRRIKKNPSTPVLSPARIAALKRSSRNRAENKPSHSMTPIILGVAFAVFIVGVVALFYALDEVVGVMTSKTAGVEIPDFSGLDRTLCEEKLNEALSAQGLKAGDVTLVFEEKYSGDAARGSVLEQSPTRGSHKKVPCTVNITLSLGPKMLTMPDYTITDWRTAKSELREMGFMITVVNEVNAAVPSGYVITTEPAPGAELIAGSNVTIHVSRGTSSGYVAPVKVPDFIGMGEADVMRTLEELKLSVGSVTYTRSPKPVGTILGQTPEADADAAPGITSVSFAVSGGADFETRFIPDVTGMSRADAAALLSTYGLRVAQTRTVASELPVGEVIAQSPKGRKTVEKVFGNTPDPDTDSVILTVSGGSGYVPAPVSFIMPRLTGITLENARVIIGLYGADVGYVWYVKSEAPAGTVIDQFIPAGTTVTGYSGEITVDLTVSGGPAHENPLASLDIPDVIGMTVDEAKRLLYEAKLIWYITEVRDASPRGTVLDQTPGETEGLVDREWEVVVMLTVSGGDSYGDDETTDTDVPDIPDIPDTPDSTEETDIPVTPDETGEPEQDATEPLPETTDA